MRQSVRTFGQPLGAVLGRWERLLLSASALPVLGRPPTQAAPAAVPAAPPSGAGAAAPATTRVVETTGRSGEVRSRSVATWTLGGLLFNRNLLDDGEPEVVAFVDDVECGRATSRVTPLGEAFLRGTEGECVVEDFSGMEQTVTLE